MNARKSLSQILPVHCYWKAGNETKYCSLLKSTKKTFFPGIYFQKFILVEGV